MKEGGKKPDAGKRTDKEINKNEMKSFADLADLVPTVPSLRRFFLTEATLRRTALTFFLGSYFFLLRDPSDPGAQPSPAGCQPACESWQPAGDASACVTAPTEVSAHAEKKSQRQTFTHDPFKFDFV